MLNQSKYGYRLYFKAISLAVVCLFVFNDIALGLDLKNPIANSALAPTSRFNPAFILEWKGDEYTIKKDPLEIAKLTGGLQEDAAFIALNLLIGQFLNELSRQAILGVSNRGLKSELERLKRERLEKFILSIKRDLPAVNFDRFHFEDMRWEGNTICLPYQRKDSKLENLVIQILKYRLPDTGTNGSSGKLPAYPMMETVNKLAELDIPTGVASDKIILEDPLEGKETPSGYGADLPAANTVRFLLEDGFLSLEEFQKIMDKDSLKSFDTYAVYKEILIKSFFGKKTEATILSEFKERGIVIKKISSTTFMRWLARICDSEIIKDKLARIKTNLSYIPQTNNIRGMFEFRYGLYGNGKPLHRRETAAKVGRTLPYVDVRLKIALPLMKALVSGKNNLAAKQLDLFARNLRSGRGWTSGLIEEIKKEIDEIIGKIRPKKTATEEAHRPNLELDKLEFLIKYAIANIEKMAGRKAEWGKTAERAVESVNALNNSLAIDTNELLSMIGRLKKAIDAANEIYPDGIMSFLYKALSRQLSDLVNSSSSYESGSWGEEDDESDTPLGSPALNTPYIVNQILKDNPDISFEDLLAAIADHLGASSIEDLSAYPDLRKEVSTYYYGAREKALEHVDLERERNAARDLRDAVIRLGDEAQRRNQKAYIALGTGWIKGYQPGGSVQYKYLNNLIVSIRKLCEAKGVEFIDGDDDVVVRKVSLIKTENKDARGLILAGKDAISAVENSLKALGLENDTNTILAEVDDRNLTEESYYRVVEMLSLMIEISGAEAIDVEVVKAKHRELGLSFISKNRILFVPKAERFNYDILRQRYEVQRFA